MASKTVEIRLKLCYYCSDFKRFTERKILCQKQYKTIKWLEDILQNKKQSQSKKHESLESFQDGEQGDSVDELQQLMKQYKIK